MDLGNYGIGGNEVKIDASEGIAEIPQNRRIGLDCRCNGRWVRLQNL